MVKTVKIPDLEFMYANVNQGTSSAFRGKWMKEEGLTAGVPDVFLPVVKIYRGVGSRNESICYVQSPGLYIEFKTKEGRTSKAQVKFIGFLKRQGYDVRIVRTWVEAKDAVIDYLGIKDNE